MRKHLLILNLAIWLTSNLYSQNNKWNLGVEAGIAFPAGKFASKNIYDSNADFAKPGPALNISLAYKLTGYAGIELLLSGQQNNVDTKTLDSKLATAFPRTQFYSLSNNWLIGKIMTGVCFSLPTDKKNKINFNARILAGILKTSEYKFSQIRLTTIVDSSLINGGGTTQAETSASELSLRWEFSYSAGAGLQYNIDKKVSLKTSIDYWASALRFPRSAYANPDWVLSGTSPPPVQTVEAYPRQRTASVNWCVGIGIIL